MIFKLSIYVNVFINMKIRAFTFIYQIYLFLIFKGSNVVIFFPKDKFECAKYFVNTRMDFNQD